MNDILFGFKEHLKVLKRSAATVEIYAEHVHSFLNTLETDVKAVTRTALETYIAGLYDYRTKAGKPYTAATLSIKVRSLKRFFEYLEETNHIFINPAEFIQEPKKVRNIPRNILTVQEARQVLDQPNLGTLTGIRDRAMLELFYSTGVRIGELCGLSIFDADLQGGMLRITKGKGRKDRVVPMGKHAVKFLREYIAKVRPRFTRNNRTERRLFIDARGKPLTKEAAGLSVRRYGKAAKIGKPVSAHTFRHTFASALVKNGADITAVQKMLGHADLTTTQTYLRALGIDLKTAHTKSHPREKEREKTIKPALERIRPAYERKPKHTEP